MTNKLEQQDEQKADAKIPGRWQLLRDLIAFQFKLTLDALRDLLLSPVSIILVIAGLVTGQKNPGKYFYDLLHLGHKSDKWINLFGLPDEENENSQISSDQYLGKVEKIVVDQYHKGGIVKSIKDGTDTLMNKLTK